MKNFELRWLERKTGKQKMNEHGYYYEDTMQVLQYRQKYYKTLYGSLGPHGDFLTELAWSDWEDVPVVTE